jgi:hypothetical protein
VAWCISSPRTCALRCSQTRRRSRLGWTSRPWHGTNSSVGSRTRSKRRPASAEFAGHERSWKRASAGPAAGLGASTASARVDDARASPHVVGDPSGARGLTRTPRFRLVREWDPTKLAAFCSHARAEVGKREGTVRAQLSQRCRLLGHVEGEPPRRLDGGIRRRRRGARGGGCGTTLAAASVRNLVSLFEPVADRSVAVSDWNCRGLVSGPLVTGHPKRVALEQQEPCPNGSRGC